MGWDSKEVRFFFYFFSRNFPYQLTELCRYHTIKILVQFSYINVVGAISSGRYFLAQLLADGGVWVLQQANCRSYHMHCFRCESIYQRWSPRGRPWGHILKSLALKVKSLDLASKPQVLENCLVLGSRTAVLFELWKFCRSPEKLFWRPFVLEISWKNYFEEYYFWRAPEKKLKTFFGEHLRLCP